MNKTRINLFVYGSLRDSAIFKSISGFGFTNFLSQVGPDMLWAEPAFLDGFRRVSPDNVYYYAVSEPSARIEGLLIHDVPAFALAEIDRYEGKRYQRETVSVTTAAGLKHLSAYAYLVSHDTMKTHFGDRYHVNLIHELWLRKRIENFIEKSTRPGEHTIDADIERRAKRELLATTERDLVITHFRANAVSDFYLEYELNRPIPSIKSLFDDKTVQPYLANYLTLVLRQVLLNQLDEKIQSHFRYQLERLHKSERYFKRSASLLMALRLVNANSDAVDMMVRQALAAIGLKTADLIDYVKYAVSAADDFFDIRVARAELERVRANSQKGLTPIGAELELSNLGYRAVVPSGQLAAECRQYGGFFYFYDFCLDVLSWKLGGYIDDHSGETSPERRSGFFELAPGRLNVAAELSRPTTDDPWLLNQLINEILRFYDVRPHSLHLSFQMRKKQTGKQRILPLEFVKCMLVLGGGLKKLEDGRLSFTRMSQREIITDRDGHEELVFSQTSRRRWYMGDAALPTKEPAHVTTQVYQYKFIRLEQRTNYEPLIMALKGLQLAYNPADYLTIRQMARSKNLRADYDELKLWADNPQPINPKTIGKFLSTIKRGLMNEHLHKPAHQLHYINWSLNAIDIQLRLFNKELGQ